MLFLLLILIILLFVMAPVWPYSRGWGYHVNAEAPVSWAGVA